MCLLSFLYDKMMLMTRFCCPVEIKIIHNLLWIHLSRVINKVELLVSTSRSFLGQDSVCCLFILLILVNMGNEILIFLTRKYASRHVSSKWCLINTGRRTFERVSWHIGKSRRQNNYHGRTRQHQYLHKLTKNAGASVGRVQRVWSVHIFALPTHF